jgi:hypothetical protein
VASGDAFKWIHTGAREIRLRFSWYLGAVVVNPFLLPAIRFCLVTLDVALVAAMLCVNTRADETSAYERAVASLAAGHRDATVMASYKTLEAAGIKAFPVLLAHVKDTVNAAPGYFVEARVDRFGNIEQPTVGDVCFRLMRHEVEGDWPKGFRDYQVLTKENVTTWWDTHRTKSLHEMRLETVRISLARAKKELEKVKSETTEAAVRFLTERSKAIQEN